MVPMREHLPADPGLADPWRLRDEPDPTESPGAGLSVQQVLAILRVRRRAAGAAFAAVLSLALIATAIMPRTFSATATLIVNLASTDPLAAKEFAEIYPSSFLPTQIELIQSADVLDAVIAQLDLASVPEFAAGNRGGEATLRDWVEARLRKSLDIEPGRPGSQLIYVTALASNAQLAAAIANTVADVYAGQSLAQMNVPSNERAERYTVELADLKLKVEHAQDAVSKFREQSGSVDLDSKEDGDLQLLNAMEQKLLDARNALRTSQAKAGNRGDAPGTTVLMSDSISQLEAERAKLDSQMAQLRGEFGPKHPKVLAIQSQIDANRASLASALSNISQANNSDINTTNAEVASLERAVAVQRQKVLQGKLLQDRAAKLQLELESAQAVYKRALDGYDQAKFATTSSHSNLTVASRARVPLKADRPNPLKWIVAGLALALLTALAVPFALEWPRRRILCADDVENSLGVPLLGTFTPLKPEGQTS